MLLQSSAVGAFWTLYIGDISNLLAAAPAAVVQARYTQDLERQADDYGAELLSRNGMSPGLLADSLQKLKASHPSLRSPGICPVILRPMSACVTCGGLPQLSTVAGRERRR